MNKKVWELFYTALWYMSVAAKEIALDSNNIQCMKYLDVVASSFHDT